MQKNMCKVIIDDSLQIADIVRVARDKAPVALSVEREKIVRRFREKVDAFLVEDRVVYGITTGVGPFWRKKISPADSMVMQEKFIMSHACNVGDPFPEEVVRAFLLVLVNNLSRGHACIRLDTLHTLITMLNKDVLPYMPQKGSVGYLQPGAHMALTLYGKGKAYFQGELLAAAAAMSRAGIEPIRLEAKEGLSLMNNSSFMTAVGSLALYDAIQLAKICDVAGALSFEALEGNINHFDSRLCAVRPYPGMRQTTDNLNKLLAGSQHAENPPRYLQDALSLRMMPQVHGACKDAIRYVEQNLQIELAAVSDNPLVFEQADENIVIHGGNCDGAPVGLALDVLAIPIGQLTNISERRLYRLLDTNLSGLPPFLINNGGLNSGFMITQYTAAALLAENKLLAQPVSVDSIPTAAGQEDYVSFGCIAAKKVRSMIENLRNVAAIELLAACQAIDLLSPGKLGAGTGEAYSLIREVAPFMEEDRMLYQDIESVSQLIRSGELVKRIEAKTGVLSY
ncbi:histidine ammonia-lyase [Sporomusa acidovorans]|uniref:Histidine ammonia-lyase n=1 Tax=Sporomusa acidovorans (strain ATCC 49682 / DSM 3132 / Mol) TaxID=1123286 RepID=A0ABZ3J9Y0_SPOA4|nr:histidine ammonia-lyase [Sporomusa acidovorans]OZC16087.1 histidine ammonia-lyase [Sporomusa acidovorans DSM 3132]SDD87125.1 histidine ammonia-lyase [Sporomusa acidovorans]